MSMTVTLYADAKVDNRGRGGWWPSKQAQTSYFDSLVKITRECRTVPLGDDILFTGSIAEIRGYSYGSIDYGDGFRYYFSVYDYDFKTIDTTVIMYKLDVWETYFDVIRIGRQHITRQPTDTGRPCMAMDYDHLVWSSARQFPWFQVEGGWRSETNRTMASISTYDQLEDEPGTRYATGDVYQLLRYMKLDSQTYEWNQEADDLYHQSLYPQIYGALRQTWVDAGNCLHASMSGIDVYHTPQNPITNVGYGLRVIENIVENDELILTKDRTGTTVFKDMHGNVIFEPAFGETWRVMQMEYRCGVGSSSCMMRLVSPSGELRYINVPGEPLDNVSDTWEQYYYRQRETDIESRNVQNQQNLVSGVASLGQGATEGAMMGAMTGSIGAGVGQVAGAVQSLVGSVGNYAANELYFNDKQQEIIDEQMKKQLDTQTLVGYANIPLNTGTAPRTGAPTSLQGIYRYTYNNATEIQNDIGVWGYPVDNYYPDGTLTLSQGKWKGDIEIIASLPKQWRDMVQERFAMGLWLV